MLFRCLSSTLLKEMLQHPKVVVKDLARFTNEVPKLVSGKQYSRPPTLADIEVTLIETHTSLHILSPWHPRQLIADLQTLPNLYLQKVD
ncbi:Transcription factor bHLH96 [Platanthera guangdongensis]|uniref:Transcription factor bHLH96 n=1 Tax=Platanthera guangdongensis TaxID=2320717 RepID=A0ABR2M1Q3_9ASPA